MRLRYMMKWIAAAVVAFGVHGAPLARAQAPAVLPTYDVATIKVHKPGDTNSKWVYADATFTATNISLKTLLSSVYEVRRWLVTGLPPWADSALYDIQAKVSDADPAVLKKLTRKDRNAMVIALLKDRFGLEAHLETKVLPIYELAVMPEGSRLHEHVALAPAGEGETPPKHGGSWRQSSGYMKATDMPVSVIGEGISYELERLIVDQTGLKATYDFELKWTPEDSSGREADNGAKNDGAPNLFTALKEQLGLQLKSAKGPVPTLVVDRVEPPKDN